jgi:glycosyltransferase involved in cell wall biosynthesis
LLTVIVPVYNEEWTVHELLRRVVEVCIYSGGTTREPNRLGPRYTCGSIQIVVVDDGSTDGTGQKLELWSDCVTVLRHLRNLGKGAAIRTGLERARGVYTIIQDADLEYDPGEYERLLEPLLAGEADVVYGSRYLGSGGGLTDDNEGNEGRRESEIILRTEMATSGTELGDSRTAGNPRKVKRWSICRWGVELLNVAVRWLYGARVSDEATCYKVFRTDDLRAMDLQCEGFEFCPEVTAKACRMGLSICEVPISYNARSVAEGKKIRWRDGWVAVKTLWRWRKWKAPETINQPERTGARKRTARRGLSSGSDRANDSILASPERARGS